MQPFLVQHVSQDFHDFSNDTPVLLCLSRMLLFRFKASRLIHATFLLAARGHPHR